MMSVSSAYVKNNRMSSSSDSGRQQLCTPLLFLSRLNMGCFLSLSLQRKLPVWIFVMLNPLQFICGFRNMLCQNWTQLKYWLEQSKLREYMMEWPGCGIGGWCLSCVSPKKFMFMLAGNTFAMQNDLELSLAGLIQLACRHRWILCLTCMDCWFWFTITS